MCPKVTSEYKTEVKERIIQSAVECFSKYGLDRTRMDDVAQKADLSKGTLYLYFKSKEDLFYVICENNLRVLKEQLSHIFATTKEDLVSNAEQFYENFHKEEKRESEKVFCEIIAESARNPKLQKILYTQRIKTFNVVREYLDRQMEKGFFKKDTDTEAVMECLIHQLVEYLARHQQGLPSETSACLKHTSKQQINLTRLSRLS